MSDRDAPEAMALSERERWERECAFRERELALAEAENRRKTIELERSRWLNPLVVAIGAATIAAFANLVVALLNGAHQRDVLLENGEQQRKLEEQKAEQSRILQMISVGDPEKAAQNLTFLLQTGLIEDRERRERLYAYLNTPRPQGTGVAISALQDAPAVPLPATPQLPPASVEVDLFACDAAGTTMRELPGRVLSLRPPDWSARWQARNLPSATNQLPQYRLNGVELRYNPDEQQAAERLRELLRERLGQEPRMVLTYFPSPNRLSLFFCEGALRDPAAASEAAT